VLRHPRSGFRAWLLGLVQRLMPWRRSVRHQFVAGSARSPWFVAGYTAHRSGGSLRDNPLPHDSLASWLDWRRGFLAAQARAERRQALHAIGLDSDTHLDLPIIDPRR
jgi:hypothetical protein